MAGRHVTLGRPSVPRRRRRAEQQTPGSPASQGDSAPGFAILEVVIAFSLLLLVLLPTAALYNRVISIAADSRNRVQAASIAAQQIAEAEATSFATLAAQVGQTETMTAHDAGMTYTVQQTEQWVNESNVANACGGTGNGGGSAAPILNVQESVTWYSMGFTSPIVSETDIAAPANYYASSLGNMAVSVEDSANGPVKDASVTLTNTETPNNTETLPTGTTGCAFAAYIDPGIYNVTVQKAGYITPTEQAAATATNVALASGNTVAVPLSYAPQAVVPISVTATATSLTSTAVTFASYPVTASNPAQGATVVQPAAPAQTLDLWPYPDGFDIYAGTCADNDPSGYQGLSGSFAVKQGATTPDTLDLYAQAIEPTNGGKVSHIQVTAQDVSSGCNNETLSFTASDSSAKVVNVALPLGKWKLSVQAEVAGQPVSGSPASDITVDGSGPLPLLKVPVS